MKNVALKLMIGMSLVYFVTACGKTGPTGPSGPQGDQGPTGPEGPGYSEVIFQPGPDIASGKDNTIASISSNMGKDTGIGFGYSTIASDYYRTLIFFDVTQAGLPMGATIVEAVLTLYPQTGTTTGNILTAKIYPLTKDWTETNSTWTAATGTTNWTTPGGDYVSTAELGGFSVDPATTAKIEIHLDVTYVQGWLNGQFNYGMLIKSDNEGVPDSNLRVYSRDYSVDTTKRPALKMIYK